MTSSTREKKRKMQKMAAKQREKNNVIPEGRKRDTRKGGMN